MFELNATHNPHRWYLDVERNLCAGPADRQFLFGGVGMAVSIQAMEQTSQRPVIWATAQYLSFARLGRLSISMWLFLLLDEWPHKPAFCCTSTIKNSTQ